jgi:small subunit ribosomal protein S1
MSKLQDKIVFYTEEANRLELSINNDLLAKVTKGLGPSIYNVDAEKVSSSDEKELETVKKNFLIKKLGLEDSPVLDEAITKVVETMGTSNKNKYRAIFYALLVVTFNKESIYDTEAIENNIEI